MLNLCVSLSPGRFVVLGLHADSPSPQDHTQERFDLHIAVGPVSSSRGVPDEMLGRYASLNTWKVCERIAVGRF